MTDKIKIGELRAEVPVEEAIWCDRKRVTIFALPWSFTKYTLTPSKLIVETGFLNKKEEEIRLYRIADISYSQSFGERISNTGTLLLSSNDVSSPVLPLEHIKNAKQVREVLSLQVEKARRAAKVRTSEMVGNFPDGEYDDDLHDEWNDVYNDESILEDEE